METNQETNSNQDSLASVNSFDDLANMFAAEDTAVKSEPVKKKKVTNEQQSDDTSSTDEEFEETEAEGDSSTTDQETEGEETESEADDEVTWASALGVDDRNVVIDEEGNFAGVKVKIDGKEDVVKLPDLIAGYQTNKYNTQKSQALSEDLKHFETGKTLVIEQYTQKLDGIDKIVQHLETKLLGEFNGVDWSRLRSENPAEWAALSQDFQNRQSEIQTMYAVINNERTEEQNKLDESRKTQLEQHAQTQIEKVYANNPTWKDPAVRVAALTEMEKFLGEAYGFTPEEFRSVQDARLLEIVKDAMKLKSGIVEGKKKLDKPLPKFQQPTSKRAKQTTKLDKLIKRADTSTGMNKRNAQIDAMAELLLTSR